jgi:hypothetical protein
MKKILSMAAAAAMMATSTIAIAQTSNENYDWYVTGEGDSRMVFSRTGGEGMVVLQGEAGARPSDCPAGAFYDTGDGIAACDDDTVFSLNEPGDIMMDDGQPFEEGAMLMTPQDPADGAADTGTTGDSGSNDGTTQQ